MLLRETARPAHHDTGNAIDSGVSLFAVALAAHLGGRVVAGVRGERVALMHEIGVDDVVDSDTTDLLSLDSFDLVLDLVGTDPTLAVLITRRRGRALGPADPAGPVGRGG